MIPWIVILIILAVLVIALVIRMIYELYNLKLAEYSLQTEKLEEDVRIVILSDLHGRHYGPDNEKLLAMVRAQKPDLILLAGDMLVNSGAEKDAVALSLIRNLTAVAPVYYGPGNHESKAKQKSRDLGNSRFADYLKQLEECGVHYLEDGYQDAGEHLRIYGLNLEKTYFTKGKVASMPLDYPKKKLGEMDRLRYNIVLAHHPGYFDSYAESGADLFVSGHYHGGAVRIPGLGGVISPQLMLFPKYSRGLFQKNGTALLVSSGCGSHKVNLRLNNRPEVVSLHLCGKEHPVV